MNFTFVEICFRLLAAVIVGGAIGLNRGLNNKSTGFRTHAIVTLGSAIATLSVINVNEIQPVNFDVISRVFQGILTGIGFLGAGVIIKEMNGHVAGLTTAATVWISAVLGAVCGFGHWSLIITSTVFILIILLFGGRIEKYFESVFKRKHE